MNRKNRNLAETRVNEIMTVHVETVMLGDTLRDAIAKMLDLELTTMPVIDSKQTCVGMISRSDLTEFFLAEDRELSRSHDAGALSLQYIYDSIETSDVRKVSEMMTYDVTSVHAEDLLANACRKMAKNRVHHLPVVDETGQIRGILSSLDIVGAVADAAAKS